ncbi:hypothetical protein GCM10022206_72740 [Streptomyces chiangmaiensis]
MPDARTRGRTRRDQALAATCGGCPAPDAAQGVRLPGCPVVLRTGEAGS